MAGKQNSIVGMLLGKKTSDAEANTGLRAQGKKPKIPKTAQDSVPYIEAYDNGVFQIEPGVFSKTFKFDEISFKTKSDEEQNRIYDAYMKFLNSSKPKEDLFISVVNLKDSAEEKAKSLISPLKGDSFDVYRREMSSMIVDKIKTSNNSIRTEKFLTVRLESPSVDEAMEKLDSATEDLTSEFKKFTKTSLKELSLASRLESLYHIMNGDEENFWFEHDSQGNTTLDIDNMARQGLTTKDIICPEFLKFNGNNFQIGNRYGQSMYLDGIANWLNSNFFTEISEMSFEGVVTMHIQAIPQEQAIKMIHNQSVNINAEVLQKQKNAMQNGYGEATLSTDLRNAVEQIEELQEDLLNRDQKLFYMSINIVHFADSPEKIKDQSSVIKNTASKHMCTIRPMMMQQERGFTSALPVGIDKGYTKRLMTTESLGVFIPFDEINQFDKGGFYYGVNSINKSLIVYNRLKGQNYNGLILGSSGSGKSFSAKREMCSVILNTDSDI